MTIGVSFQAPDDRMDSSATSGPIDAISACTANPIIMSPVTMMSPPIWVAAPSFDDMRRAYPARGAEAQGFG